MAQWRKIIVSGSNAELSHLSMSGDIDLTGNITGSSTSTGSFGYLAVSGDTTIGGNITFGDANTDFVSFSADIDSNLIPNSDDTYDIGSATQAWQDLFLEGDITLTDAGKVVTTAGNLTVDSEAATLVLDGHTGVDIDASNSGKVAIDGAGGIDIGVAADVAIDVDASTFDLDASGALTMTSTTMAFDPSSTFDIDAAGAVTIDGSAITIGGDSDVAIDIDSSTLDIDASGALTMTSTTMALDPSSTFDLDAAGAVTIDGSAITIGADDSGVAISIGHSTSETTINDNLTVTGDLDVNGTLTTIDTTNLRVADRFIQVASGSTTGDGGMVVTTAANGSGSALFWDDSATRWGLTGADETGDSQISADPRQFVVSVSGSAVDASSNPSDFGGAAANRIGMMHVNTATGDIFIFS